MGYEIYLISGSPYAWSVMLAMEVKGLAYEPRVLNRTRDEHKAPEFLAINPRGLVPVLKNGDLVICEAVAILAYLDKKHPEPPLLGLNAVERAQVEMWNRRMELEILLPSINVFAHTHEMWKGVWTQIPEWGELCRENALARLEWLDGEIAGREYVVNDTYTVADITLQCALVLGKAVGVRVPENLSNVNAWFERVAARPTARA